MRKTAPVLPRAAVSGGGDSSTTNIQEAGGAYDEPDIVKSDGTNVYTLTHGTLRATDARGNARRFSARCGPAATAASPCCRAGASS